VKATADGKWIRDLTASTPLADAARRVLTVRLQTVRDCLRLALYEADKDPEHVHQLRVGTRRAQAALDTFAPCLPRKVSRAAKKHLRRLRRTVGQARDWDVFLADLADWAPRQSSRHRPGLDFLAGYALAQRLEAHTRLKHANTDYPFSFDRFLAETVATVRRPRARGVRLLGDLARPLLSGLFKELDQAAARDLGDDEHLHQLRILGKRLRYAMEVFANCFAPPFREQLYPAVKTMQEILGNANDSHVACGRLEALRARLPTMLPSEWKRLRAGIEGMLRHQQERLLRERKHFREWRGYWKQSGGESAFTALLQTAQRPA
jgi:CHAD domain-containing protein